jgi:hypothetical protein
MKRLVIAVLASLTALVALPACDWIHYAFMNSIPFKGKAAKGKDVYVYLGVDGLSYHVVKDLMDHGLLSGPEWHLSKLITMFPGTSDASWTRTMHTPKIGGYEIEYYDPTKDEVVNHGLPGLAKHLMPSFADFINFEFDYLKAFDFRANGYTAELNAYADTFASLGDSIDNLFFLLDGRVQTTDVFSAYLIEFDVMGHMRTQPDVGRAFKMLADRIQKFREHHKDMNVHFTLFSDHGMDFIHVQNDRFVKFDDELAKAGITPVEHLSGHDPKRELFAIPIMHTRVTYLALHTHPDLVEEISGRISMLPSVDLALHKLKLPPKTPVGAPHPLSWYEIWAEGKPAVYFGFDAESDEYYLPADGDYARIDFHPQFQPGQDFLVMSDDDLFAATKLSHYPDVFYRTRTSLEPVSFQYPADVLVSFRPTYASLGFSLPGANDIASAGFHGAMEELGTAGTLLSSERELPDAVRADTILELFPRIKDHMHHLGVETIDGDRNASLHYK